MAQPATASMAVESIHRLVSDLCSSDYSFECPRRFSGYAQRLQLVLAQLLRASPSPENAPASVQTALKGIAGDLHKAAEETLSVYRSKSKIFVLVNCHNLSASLQERAASIGGWLALMDSALHDNPDLHKKIADLSRDMKQSHFEVTENEERVYCTLQKEGQGRQTSKAVQSAIVMDLARALGIDSNNHSEISEQIKLLKNDLSNSNSASERRILISLERILDNWSIEPSIATLSWDLNFEDDAQITPFKNFLCPLTKEVMKEPVVLESSQTYERTAIEYWFQRCIEDGRDPTCPVTGQVLKSLQQKPNIGLAGAIEEWVNRNVEIQVKVAVQYLSEDPPSIDCIERVLDNIYKISEEHPSNRYIVRNAHVVLLIVKLLRNGSNIIGTHLRSKALMALLSMSKDEESKKIMLEEGITRLAIRSLIGSSEKEKECAVKLLHEFCSDEAYCRKIAPEKGALVLLSSMAEDLEHPSLSNLAEEVLRRMEKVEDIIEDLALAGRFEPLLSRLCDGPNDAKIEMAYMVGRMTLTNSSKELIARQSARILVELLSKPEGKAPSLQALHSLSELDDNVSILVDSAVLPALTDILFATQDTSPQLRELAASTFANIVSNPGHWELGSVDKEGHSVQSQSLVFHLLGLLSFTSPLCQMYNLHILCGIASSPQATVLECSQEMIVVVENSDTSKYTDIPFFAESVASHIVSGDGFRTIVPFLEHPEVQHRTYAFRLTRLISERFGEDVARELKLSNKISVFTSKLLDTQSTDDERSDSACVLANLAFSEDEVKTFLGASFVRWIVTSLKDQHNNSTQLSSSMVEGLLGLLLHFTRGHDPETLSAIKDHRLLTIFCDQLVSPSPTSKQLAALGLKNLSETGMALSSRVSEPLQPPQGFCSVFMCFRASPDRSTCPVHNIPCEEASQFCLLKNNCIKPLLDLLKVKDTDVQIAALDAFSTLILDTSSDFKRAVDELEQLGVIDAVVGLFIEVRPGELQERAIWIIEKILRVEGHTQLYSLNQSLVRALVEAFKHGNANTKRHAQDALTSLKQISGVSGRTSNQTRGRR